MGDEGEEGRRGREKTNFLRVYNETFSCPLPPLSQRATGGCSSAKLLLLLPSLPHYPPCCLPRAQKNPASNERSLRASGVESQGGRDPSFPHPFGLEGFTREDGDEEMRKGPSYSCVCASEDFARTSLLSRGTSFQLERILFLEFFCRKEPEISRAPYNSGKSLQLATRRKRWGGNGERKEGPKSLPSPLFSSQRRKQKQVCVQGRGIEEREKGSLFG